MPKIILIKALKEECKDNRINKDILKTELNCKQVDVENFHTTFRLGRSLRSFPLSAGLCFATRLSRPAKSLDAARQLLNSRRYAKWRLKLIVELWNKNIDKIFYIVYKRNKDKYNGLLYMPWGARTIGDPTVITAVIQGRSDTPSRGFVPRGVSCAAAGIMRGEKKPPGHIRGTSNAS